MRYAGPERCAGAAPLLVACLTLLAGPVAAHPQVAGGRPSEEGGRSPASLEAARRTGRIHVDGRLDEDAWRRASVADDFVQGEPREGADPFRPTEVRVLYDGEALYVGARLHDDPGAIAEQLVRRDERCQCDYFEVLLDPNLDRQTGYLFRVTSSGVERDAVLFADEREDENWDAVWEAEAAIDSGGWSAEMRIPLSQIRYESHDSAQAWGANFVRRRLASNSTSYFSLQSRTVEGRVSQFGRLTGLRLAESERRFEVKPYVAGELFTAPADPGDPYFDGSSVDGRAGVDLSYGIGSAFSLDATLNPDFGQVEVDPAVVNLSAFETFFPEKRPFFVQDAQIFDFDLAGRRASLFFSRRIGRRPRGDAPGGADFVDAPSRTTILGATKLTGRTAGGLSVGVLGAVTEEETGVARFVDEGREEEFVAAPRSGYGVARLRQDFREGATRLGAIATGMRRDLPGDGSLDFLPREAFSGGVDFEHQWGGPESRRWAFSGFVAGTHVRGSREAMLGIQTNSQHYFQRPDAEDLAVDSSATSLTGATWQLEFQRQSAEHLTWSVWLGEVTPDFAANDMGFFSEGESYNGGARISYQEIEPGRLFRSWNVRLFAFHDFRHELLDDIGSADGWTRAYKGGQFSLEGEGEFHNNWRASVEVEWSPESLSDTETRGGPLMTDPASKGIELRMSTDRRRTVSGGPSVEYTERALGAGDRFEVGFDVNVRPAPSFELSLEPRVSFEDDAAQFVGDSEAVPHPPTYGTRYLFSDLERTELSLETRLNVAFSPELSLQLFLQPLVSAGDFTSIKELARPESFAFDVFEEGEAVELSGGIACLGGRTCTQGDDRYLDFDGDGRADDSLPLRDFNFRSVRGDAVLRWEYMPGSILFLVWQQDRAVEAPVGDVRLDRDLDALFGADAENIFILKVRHFLDL